MGLRGGGVLAMWWDADPAGDADMNEWHAREHFPERLGIPGFLRGRRFTGGGHPTYFTLYEAEGVEVFGHPAYLERLNHPTDWTRRALASFRNMKRTAYRVVAARGVTDGGVMATLELQPADPGRLREWLRAEALPALVERQGVVAAHLCEPDYERTTVDTEEKKLRSQPDALAGWLLLVEGIDPDLVWSALVPLQGGELARHGASDELLLRLYRLAFALDRPALRGGR
ncbi:MAG TPA: hypothetical protein VFD01_01790 [Candidatus Dormibacteraeota bacterium]|nr:hypothetical protein [Candidatus Dormibacteraeota bacterium]